MTLESTDQLEATQTELVLMPANGRPGMRLVSIEVLNWGTFDKRVWRLSLDGQNALLTGDIGSGKSTFVDAITTLLVPANRIAYNKAAGAEARERDLRSYVLGYYKSERGEAGLSSRPVALRNLDTYAVILGHFRNEGFGQDVTLAQVFHFRDREGQPARFYVVADRHLSIAEHFRVHGDIAALRKRLRKEARTEMFDAFPAYGAAFRRRFGIENEQALDLFHQTVSMKQIGDLTQFVRAHMLEAFDVDARMAHMIGHFDDLDRAHAAVLKAKDQVARLTPLVEDCDRHAALSTENAHSRACRDAIGAYFEHLKAGLLETRIAGLDSEAARLSARRDAARHRLEEARLRRDGIKQAIAANGGDRIEAIARDINTKAEGRVDRQRRAEQYDRLAKALDLASVADADAFLANADAIVGLIERAEVARADLDNRRTDATIEWRRLNDAHKQLMGEITSLEGRKSNLPARTLAVRDRLCSELRLDGARLPFAGELIEVRPEARAWEGAAERLLHAFAQSLLVPDELYQKVAGWVDDTHLAERLVYYRVRAATRLTSQPEPGRSSLVHKLALKAKSEFYDWLDREVTHRFDYVCSESLEDFRRQERAITRMGQIKARGERHEKDDRFRIDDRTRYVLGWSNAEKIRALKASAKALESRIAVAGQTLSGLDTDREVVQRRLGLANELKAFVSFPDIDWRQLVVEIEGLEAERRRIEEGSDTLRTLRAQLAELDESLSDLESAHVALVSEHGGSVARRHVAAAALAETRTLISQVVESTRTNLWPALEQMRPEALGDHRLTVEACASHATRLREWIQARMNAEEKRLNRLTESIVKAMQAYAGDYPAETREVDASVASAGEYREMLRGLVSDGLPAFEARFKALLNENTIREVAALQSQLNKERQLIGERIGLINQSLRDIDYNTGRFIELIAERSGDQEVRQFIDDLRACTEGTLTGSDDAEYSEAKFLQVKGIIERFKGRPEKAEFDRRWTRKVTDVRNWYQFSASEKWREDGREHEHYTDSGGKSGGQKEKLAYTVLAASLAYQFGIDWRAPRSRTFHFVVIDEAFGRGSDESAEYGLRLFTKMNLQVLVATPLQKIHVIEPFVAAVGFVHNEGGQRSMLRNLSIEEYREERLRRAG